MSDNFHTPWEDGVTRYRQADMNVPISDLDRALSYTKNVLIWCEGSFSYTKAASGELSWDDDIKIGFLDEYGDGIINKIAPSSVTLASNQLIFVDLVDTNGVYIEMEVASIPSGETQTFGDYDRCVLALKADNDELYYVNLKPTFLSVESKPYDVGGAYVGAPTSGEIIMRYPFPRTVVFSAGLTDSQAVCGTPATDDTYTLSIKKDGVEVGTMLFYTGEYTGNFTMASQTTFVAGEVMTIVPPVTDDSTISDIGFAVVGERSS